ncbi:PLP-dependent aminotransferase family protein [Paenibacillus sp. MER 99-2]|uniref:MocR-like pyridoxine biosynthesis transcription factor PdxR n=1 Tax=Paenibacillus sp. MER 99-2 TaxID=2939572 RepID=UPI002041F873|nr:PLP-dependent aminotransferase family protein [Paenibacillus sp. MER 99-2]MCM3173933.1 PLP-dependent aminotransferase family protein [Paenibacillus sp. MER 99-2]
MKQMPTLEENTSRPVYVQLSDHIKREIMRGELAEDAKLPSIRKLAEMLGISSTPVEWAYQQLIAEGYVYSQPRRGFRVRALTDGYGAIQLPMDNKLHHRITPEQPQYPDTDQSAIRPTKNMKYDFHMSRNDFSLFPYAKWQQYTNRIWREEADELLFYGDPQGEWGLRCEIATYLGQFRGVRCSPEQIVVGAEQHLLMTLLVQTLFKLGGMHSIGVERPGYRLLPGTFRHYGYQVVPISLDEEGLDITALERSGVKLVGVSPSHQFPMGMTMPIARRLALLDWAEREQAYIIEDDYDGEFRYHGRPIPSMQGLREDSRVIYMGGFSQVLAPALCIHYMVLPMELMHGFREMYRDVLFEQSASRLIQRTLEVFMREGELGKHIRKMRNLYKRKHDLLVQSIRRHFGEQAEISGQNAGFHLVLRITSSQTASVLVQAVAETGVQVSSTEYLWGEASSPRDGKKEFIIGFAGIEAVQIDQGIEALAKAWRSSPS